MIDWVKRPQAVNQRTTDWRSIFTSLGHSKNKPEPDFTVMKDSMLSGLSSWFEVRAIRQEGDLLITSPEDGCENLHAIADGNTEFLVFNTQRLVFRASEFRINLLGEERLARFNHQLFRTLSPTTVYHLIFRSYLSSRLGVPVAHLDHVRIYNGPRPTTEFHNYGHRQA